LQANNPGCPAFIKGLTVPPVLPDLDKRTLRPAAFLDRDGVLLCKDDGAVGGERLNWISNAASAIRRLNDAGYLVLVVTNQPGVAQGLFTQEEVEKLHVRMRLALRAEGARIDDIRYCPYHPDATVAAYRRDSDWRKPRPGMIFDLMRFWPIELERSFLIGTQPADLEAAQAAGIRGYLLADGNLPALVETALAA
jgi:D-glycero-D-manno-heptose 1,7-bisphosphate phosphatase